VSFTKSLVVTLVVAAAVAAGNTVLLAQSRPAPGGLVEPASSPSIRPVLDPPDGRGLARARGAFTFPDPYNTAGVRLTVADDCGGHDCVKPVGYSYWSNINNHVGRNAMLIFLGLDRRRGGPGPSLFSVNKQTGETRNLGPLFPASSPFSWSSGEGWYFSHTRPHTLYMHSGPNLLRYDVQTRIYETVFDVTEAFGADRYIWQAHSSADDRVHSATLRDSRTYASLGCLAYRENLRQWFFAARLGDFDECQVDKSGRWLVIKENVDGRNGEDNRVIDLETGEERVLLDENGAGGHSDLGFGYMVAIDNFSPKPGAVRTWRFDMDLGGGQPAAAVSGQGTIAYHHSAWGSGGGHIAHGNALAGVDPERQIACGSYASRSDVPRQHEIVCYRLDGTLDTLIVAPTMINLDAAGGGTDYNKLPKGNLDVTGQYFIWTANTGTDRLDAYIVRVPAHLIAPLAIWEPVRWLDRVNTIVVGPTLRKTSGCSSCADAGAASEQWTTAGDVAVRFSASETTTNRFVGFSGGNSTTEPAEILFGLRLLNGIAEVRESGVYRKDVTFVTGDTFEIRVESGLVHYVKNGAVFYTSTEAPRYPLQVDTSLVSAGATVDNAMIRQGS
jgi:hypothetical protein